MVKKKSPLNSNSGLGRHLIKEKKVQQQAHRQHVKQEAVDGKLTSAANVEGNKESWLLTSELEAEKHVSKLTLTSVTEENALDRFLKTAELAQKEYELEKQNIKILTTDGSSDLLPTDLQNKEIEKLEQKHQEFLTVPRRPRWDEHTTSAELAYLEEESFLEWRRKLAIVEETKNLTVTPFEKNLDIWRQLWRVIERSDIVVQIVDARHPLLFVCHDLCDYVKETGEDKVNAFIINKAELLSVEQRSHWFEYFKKQEMHVVFWSALQEQEKLEERRRKEREEMEDDESRGEDESRGKDEVEDDDEEEDKVEDDEDEEDKSPPNEKNIDSGNKCMTEQEGYDGSEIISSEGLFQWLKALSGRDASCGQLMVGLVGYPNVGKSSTINVLLGQKRVAVSATPGKTKHFQTFILDDALCLCDCPGLVMPSFARTKAEMVVSGILSIDQMRDHAPPISLVCQRIPRLFLEATYSITLPHPREGEDKDRPPTQLELCSCYAYRRGFMTSKGVPDCSRASRYILKDYVKGKLLYCHAPPGVDQSNFHTLLTAVPRLRKDVVVPNKEGRDFDRQFFSQNQSEAHFKGRKLIPASDQLKEKPWKKHNNYKKKEKARRVYNHLDN